MTVIIVVIVSDAVLDADGVEGIVDDDCVSGVVALNEKNTIRINKNILLIIYQRVFIISIKLLLI